MPKAALAMTMLLLAGCWLNPTNPSAQKSAPTTQASTRPAPILPPTPLVAAEARPRNVKASDPPPSVRPIVSLSVYHLSVPLGTVSASETFWKRVDEQAMDIAVHDVLYKNGLRVGRAALADFEPLMQLLQAGPVQSKPVSYIAAGAKSIELPMKQHVTQQILYDFDLRNTMTVRSYDDADNLFVLEFQPIHRKPGDVRVSLCPMVRSLRKRLTAIGDIETREIVYRSPEKYFELNLRTDLPLDSFLIIAPSPESKSTMSLGHAFLIHDATAERREDLLLILPQPLQPRPPKPDSAPREPDKKSPAK